MTARAEPANKTEEQWGEYILKNWVQKYNYVESYNYLSKRQPHDYV